MDLGKNLPCPEYVPFRLTINIEYGLGNLRGYGIFYCEFMKYFIQLKERFSTIIDSIDLFRNPEFKIQFY